MEENEKQNHDLLFKGGKLINRYKLTAVLKTVSPLHIGDGDRREDQNRLPLKDKDQKKPDEKPYQFTTVVTDANGRAYIPGSTLKGCLRNWLTQLFVPFPTLACTNDDQRAEALRKQAEKFKSDKMGLGACLAASERLFGSAVNEGKLEFWDAPMIAPPPIPANLNLSPADAVRAYSGYDSRRGTLILKSVAIDPVTGTAAKNKLYNYEVVPAGAQFELTVCGQNLTEMEVGMLLFGIGGFNSQIYPVTLGAMGGLGYGRFEWYQDKLKIAVLDRQNFDDWLKEAIETGHTGYDKLQEASKKGHTGYSALKDLPADKQKDKIKQFKTAFLQGMTKKEDQ